MIGTTITGLRTCILLGDSPTSPVLRERRRVTAGRECQRIGKSRDSAESQRIETSRLANREAWESVSSYEIASDCRPKRVRIPFRAVGRQTGSYCSSIDELLSDGLATKQE
jgi:hypothetical protein